MDRLDIKKYYIKVKNFLLKRTHKEFLIFMLFFLASAAFWMLQSLEETYDVELNVPLRLTDVPDNVVITTDLPEELRVVVRDRGTVMLRYLYGAVISPVSVSYRKYDEGNVSGRMPVPHSDVMKLLQGRLAPSTHIVSVHPDTLEYFFNRGARKRVPVRMAGSVATDPQHYLQRVSCLPDSVDVLAPPAILDTIKAAYTMPVELDGLSAGQKVSKRLHAVRGAKFIPDEVDVNIAVDMYTEKTVEVPVVGVNFPGSKDLRTFPATVSITFRIGMSRFKMVNSEDFVLAVTYEELMNNESSRIRLRLKSIPPGVSNVRISPAEVDYLIEQVSADE